MGKRTCSKSRLSKLYVWMMLIHLNTGICWWGGMLKEVLIEAYMEVDHEDALLNLNFMPFGLENRTSRTFRTPISNTQCEFFVRLRLCNLETVMK